MMIDSHCHLHEPVFRDLRGTLTRAIDHDVWGIIAVGCDPATNAKTLEVAGHHGKAIWPCLGCHPEWTSVTDTQMEEVEHQIGEHHSRLVAPAEVTRQIVEAGYLVSVTPEVVYRERDRELVEWVPLESLLVETDSPWPYKGEFEGLPTEPWMAARVAEEVAKLKQLPVDEVMFRLSANACQLFDLPYA